VMAPRQSLPFSRILRSAEQFCRSSRQFSKLRPWQNFRSSWPNGAFYSRLYGVAIPNDVHWLYMQQQDVHLNAPWRSLSWTELPMRKRCTT